MAQRSQKTLAARNAATLNRTHLTTLAIHLLFHISRFLLSSSRRSLFTYLLLTLPSLVIEFYFERLSRPTHNADSSLLRAGEDLEAKGLTEWMWDLLYWTWGCVVLVSLVGDRGWWAWIVVPGYSAWLAFTTFTGMKSGLGGMMGAGGNEGSGGAESKGDGQSRRQAKMEKRGGQKMVYR